MKETETLGLMVMVSPVLWTSAYAGQIGTIEFADFSAGNIWVKFEDEELDCFSPKTLFVLKTADELNELAQNDRGLLWQPLPQNLLVLAALQTTGKEKQLKSAFGLVQGNPELHRLATIRLNEVVEPEQRRKIGR